MYVTTRDTLWNIDGETTLLKAGAVVKFIGVDDLPPSESSLRRQYVIRRKRKENPKLALVDGRFVFFEPEDARKS